MVSITRAVAVEAARIKKDEERTRLLNQALAFLARAAESSPDDPMVHFNYGLALFLTGKFAESSEQLKPVITANPRDGQAYFLYARPLRKSVSAEIAAAADDQARAIFRARSGRLNGRNRKPSKRYLRGCATS